MSQTSTRRIRRIRSVALALGTSALLVASLAACSSGSAESVGTAPGADGKLTTVKLATPPFAFEGVEIAIRNGIFKKYGLDVEADYAGGDPTSQIAKVVSGELDLAMSGGPDVVRAVAKGIPVVITGGAQHASGEGDPTDGVLVAADSPIKSMKELAGKTIGIAGLGSLPQVVNDMALEQNGVDYTTVKYINLPADAIEGAVQKGQVDAGLPTSVYYTKAVADGLRALGRGTKEFFPGAPQIVWVASKTYTQQHADTLDAFNKAMAEADDYANAHPDMVRQIDHEKTKLPADFIDNRGIEPMTITVDEPVYKKLVDAMVQFEFVDKKVSIDQVLWSDAPKA